MNSKRTARATAQKINEDRLFNLSLRYQQDEEYQRSLEADREKARKKKQQEEESRLEKEKAEHKRLEIIRLKKEIQMEIPTEPDTSHPDTIRVLLKLPNGSRLERRFNKHVSLQILNDFVFVHEATPDDFDIVKSHPRTNMPCNKQRYSPFPEITSCSSFIQNIPTFAEMGFQKCELLHVHDNEA